MGIGTVKHIKKLNSIMGHPLIEVIMLLLIMWFIVIFLLYIFFLYIIIVVEIYFP